MAKPTAPVKVKLCVFCCEPCPPAFDFCDTCVAETYHSERVMMVRAALKI